MTEIELAATVEDLLHSAKLAQELGRAETAQALIQRAEALLAPASQQDGGGDGQSPEALRGWVMVVVGALIASWQAIKGAGGTDEEAFSAALDTAISTLGQLQGNPPPAEQMETPVHIAISVYLRSGPTEEQALAAATDAVVAFLTTGAVPAIPTFSYHDIGGVYRAADEAGFFASASNVGALLAHLLESLQAHGLPPFRALTETEAGEILTAAMVAYAGEGATVDGSIVASFAAASVSWGL